MKNRVHLSPIKNYASINEWRKVCLQKIVQSPELLEFLLTSHEREDIVIRAAVLDRLSMGKSYRDIGREFGSSSQTVSAIKKAFTDDNYRSYLERSKAELKKMQYGTTHKSKKYNSGSPHRNKFGTKIYF